MAKNSGIESLKSQKQNDYCQMDTSANISTKYLHIFPILWYNV